MASSGRVQARSAPTPSCFYQSQTVGSFHEWVPQFVLYWVLCFVLSYPVYVLYERRMTAFRERFASRETGQVDRDLLLKRP